MQSLPIDSHLPQIIEQIRDRGSLALEAPPGTGKTTRVPAALLDELSSVKGEILTLEPRRLAARMAARRVAEERGEKVGDSVGYQIRFEEVAGPKTRLRFLTEGVLTRRLVRDPELRGVGAVILDEFHERHLQTDLALALLRRMQKGPRPDLKLVVMSATLSAAPVAGYLGDAPILRTEGKRFEVAIEHMARPDERPLHELVSDAIGRLIAAGLDGDVLVFLPGAAEIRRAQGSCARLAQSHDLLLLPLHGDLSAEEQDQVVRPAGKRKVILSTNVAESSVTIDGVVAVIDSGLARIAGHSPWSGLPTLEVGKISRASATQRAGRAGRTRPGRCLRLYTQQDFNARPEHQAAEVHRLDLTEASLELHAAGVRDLRSFEWFETPPQSSIEAADQLLLKLGAIDEHGQLTATGDQMLRYPLHPRQSRMMVEAASRNVIRQAAVIAALIGERDLVLSGLFSGGRRGEAVRVGPSDLLDRLDLFEEAMKMTPSRMKEAGLDRSVVAAVDRVRLQLLGGRREAASGNDDPSDDALLLSILAGYPDRVARRRTLKSDNLELLLSGGGAATLSESSVVRRSEFVVAVDAEERREKGRLIRLASEIKPEWLIELFAERLTEKTEAIWRAQHERVEVIERLLYDQLIISESRSQQAAGEEVSRVLAEAALNAGLQKFIDPEAPAKFLARLAFAAQSFPERNFPVMSEEDVREALVRLCEGRRSFAELREAAAKNGLIEVLKRTLTSEQARSLDKIAPEQIDLARRRRVPVHYEISKTPWIESRLQDFFGMKSGPTIAEGRLPLTLHLLAPNGRAVQVTSDLSGFWQRTYSQVRRELSRRYPRHPWPEDPLHPSEKGR
jgi:ATP-dependent helicase HrpB